MKMNVGRSDLSVSASTNALLPGLINIRSVCHYHYSRKCSVVYVGPAKLLALHTSDGASVFRAATFATFVSYLAKSNFQFPGLDSVRNISYSYISTLSYCEARPVPLLGSYFASLLSASALDLATVDFPQHRVAQASQ